MSRRYNRYSIFIATCIMIILIFTGSEYISDTRKKFSESIDKTLNIITPSKDHEDSSNQQGSVTITKLIEKTRSKIKFQLSKYNFSHSDVHRLDDLLMESGGKPIRSLVLSSWRSGSTFFGEMLSSIPGTYYHYEPLLKFGIVQIRAPPDSNQAVNTLKKMLKCNFDEMEDYFEFGKTDSLQFRQNKMLWEHCKKNRELCFDAEFTSQFCKLFPFQTMKVCRLRLRFVQDILDDENLNVKVILLIRDPRGVFNSRRHRYFCQTGLDCWQPELLCGDMIRDYITASQLLPLYPDRIMVIRFEDLALNPHVMTNRILHFLRLDRTPSIDEFLESHTSVEVAGFDSTFRVSRNIPFKWRYLLNFKDVDEIQIMCKEAMQMWGYRMTYNATHMASKEFSPLDNYTITRKTNYY